jgi:hypothetical protein
MAFICFFFLIFLTFVYMYYALCLISILLYISFPSPRNAAAKRARGAPHLSSAAPVFSTFHVFCIYLLLLPLVNNLIFSLFVSVTRIDLRRNLPYIYVNQMVNIKSVEKAKEIFLYLFYLATGSKRRRRKSKVKAKIKCSNITYREDTILN